MNEAPAPTSADILIATLTPREKPIAIAIAKGLTNREISKALNISIKTVDTHRLHILKKLKCESTVALVYFMLRAGLVTL